VTTQIRLATSDDGHAVGEAPRKTSAVGRGGFFEEISAAKVKGISSL
jgi:hypothetical protein